MRMFFALMIAWASAGTAIAADQPEIGPPPAWVKPVALPEMTDQGDGAAVRVLLQDQQIALEPGQRTVYTEFAIQIQTPQGLAAGNISLPWRPETDVLTVHKLHILRGGKVIDVLGSGQTFSVIRRETNLESAMLDGILTANIQPEGLQVGDVIDMAGTVISRDPTLKDHVETLGGGWDTMPVERAHLRIQWPSSMPVRLRRTDGFPELKRTTNEAMTSVELSLTDVEPYQLPDGAPGRFRIGRMVELTDFQSWADLSMLMAPLYTKAAVLPAEGPLRAELARIEALSPDKIERAEAALALVQDRVRYVALSMGQGGLVPADAETTWSRRFGDCKGKTALLLALLHALDIEAVPVAVSTALGDGLDQRLPMVGLFDHVLVRATIKGRDYWLDGTRTGDKRLDAIRTPAFGWGLPLVADRGALVRMMPPPLDEPTEVVEIRMDASAGLTVPAPVRIERTTRGDAAVALNMTLANLTPGARERRLREYWKDNYDFIDVTSVSADFDPQSSEQRLVMEGKARMDWDGGTYETDGTDVGYKADFSREPGLNSDAPFAVPYPYYTRTIETIILPPGFDNFATGDNAEVDQVAGGIEYRRHATIEDGIFRIEKSERSVASEFPADDAPAEQAALRALAEKDVHLRAPPDYEPTEAELAQALQITPTDADGFLNRGQALLEGERYEEAIADFDRAAALAPDDAWPLANRGIAYVWTGDMEAATKDLEAASALDPRNPVVFRARGMMAQIAGEPEEAVVAYTTSLEIDPGNDFALGRRAQAYREIGESKRALADATAAIERRPKWLELYLLRANAFRDLGREEEGVAQAAAVAAADPESVYAHVAAARIYAGFGRDAEAMREFDRAIAIKPEAYIYLNRAQVRPKEDAEGRRADIEAALRLDPKSVDALALKAHIQRDRGDHAASIASWSAAISSEPDANHLLVGRGITYMLAGQKDLAEKDFAAARAHSTLAAEFNNMCWAKATAGVALHSALQDCDMALEKKPESAAYLDSRALVLLQLGRFDEAIEYYDRALAKRPTQPGSLFGRAVAWARKGDKSRSDADLTAALKVDPDVQKEFVSYGIEL